MSTTDTENVVTGAENASQDEQDGTKDAPELDLTSGDGIAMAMAQHGDASVQETDLPTVLEIETEIQKDAGALATTAGKLLNLRKKLARLAVRLMPFVLLPSGLPDWDGTSKGFKILFDEQIDAALTAIGGNVATDKIGKQERKNLLNSIRGHVKRTYLDPAIRAWVFDTSEAVRASMPNGRKKDGTYADPDSELFKHLVRNEYQRCSLTPPNRYLSPEEVAAKRSESGPGTDPVDPAQQLRRMVEGAEKVSAHFHAAEALQLVTSLATRVTDQKNSQPFDREQTSLYCARVADIALYVVRYLDGSVTDPTTDGIVDAYWTEQDAEALA